MHWRCSNAEGGGVSTSSPFAIVKGEKMTIEITDKIEAEAAKEIDRLKAWMWGFEESSQGNVSTWNAVMNRAYFRFKTTLMCTVIAHRRGCLHLGSFEEQEKFLEDNRVEWESLQHRQPVIKYETKFVKEHKKSLLQKLRELV